MQTSRRGAHLGVAAAAAVFLGSMLLIIWQPNGAPSGVAVGQPIPDWQAQDLRGGLVSSEITAGRVTVLFFTAARCPVANSHAPRVRELAAQYADDSRVQFLAIYSGVTHEVERNEIRVLERVLELPFRSLIDPSGDLAARFGHPKVLTYFVIDADGILRQSGSFQETRDHEDLARPTCTDTLQRLLRTPDQVAGSGFDAAEFQ